jgi:hypothetical protein
MITSKVPLLLLFTALCAAEPALVLKDGAVVIHPPMDDAMLVNPGKGWVSYHASPAQVAAAELAYISIGYSRFEWGGIQPTAEDQYDWQQLDAFLNAWDAVGRQAAFGIMSANTHSSRAYVTPKWVFDAGAKSTTVTIDARDPATGNPGTYLQPDCMDPVYLQKLEVFIKALARRYDGDPRIAFLDIRSFGNWGESYHEAHVLLYAKYFHKTRLCQSCDGGDGPKHADFCAGLGIAVRRDGIGGSDGRELIPAIGRVPAIYEFWGSLDYLVKRGWWRDGAMLREALEVGKPTYVEFIRNSPELLKHYPQVVARLTNRIGYHFILQQVTLPSKIVVGQAIPIEWQWRNAGVARLYEPCQVAIALLDRDDRVIHKRWLPDSHPASWQPDATTAETLSVAFPQAAPGTYKLAVGLYRDREAAVPAYRLGLRGRTSDGWYVISDQLAIVE